MIQQGQVFKLKAKCADGEPLWAYRYRVAGRGSARLQVGGFSSKAEAQRALQNKLARLLPGRRAAALTLGEWVEEYLDTHQGERVTVAKLRWLLGKATADAGRGAPCRALAGAGLRVAADGSGRAPLRGDAGAAAGAESGGCVEADRREPGQAWGAESWPALPGAAAVRFLGADPVGRRAARADVRADGRVRGRDRASTLGAVRARTGRRRS